MDIHKESKRQCEIADYNVYLQLKALNYANQDIAGHLSYSLADLGFLISRYTFEHSLEFKPQEKEGNYYFNGTFYITQTVKDLLTVEEILEIYIFTQDLVKQHNGIDYLQSFYHIEQNCKLFFIDQLDKQMIESKRFNTEDNYCTLMLADEY